MWSFTASISTTCKHPEGCAFGKLPDSLFGSHLARLFASEIPGVLKRVDKETFTPEEYALWQSELERTYPTAEAHPDKEFNEMLKLYLPDWGSAFVEPVWDRLDPMLRELNSICQRNGWEMYWVAFPSYPQVTHPSLKDFPQQKLRGIAGRARGPPFGHAPLAEGSRARTSRTPIPRSVPPHRAWQRTDRRLDLRLL